MDDNEPILRATEVTTAPQSLPAVVCFFPEYRRVLPVKTL